MIIIIAVQRVDDTLDLYLNLFINIYYLRGGGYYGRNHWLCTSKYTKTTKLSTQKSLIIDTAKQYGWSNVTFYDDKKTGRHTKRSAIKIGRNDYI